MGRLVFALALLPACLAGRYLTPGKPADLSLFADPPVRALLDRKPVAPFPARLAVVRVQGPGYRSQTAHGWGRGGFTIVTTRDVEEDEQFDRIAALPQVAAVARMNKLLFPRHLGSEMELRKAAAAVQADVVLVYTFDTAFHVDRRLRPATFVSLGLFPNRKARVHATAAGLLVDTRTGFVFGTVEATANRSKLANAWSSRQAVDDSRRRAESEAFEGLVREVERAWPGIARRHGGSRTLPAAYPRYATGGK